jgi:hypothetical protein
VLVNREPQEVGVPTRRLQRQQFLFKRL